MTSWKAEVENRGRKLFRISLLSLLTSMVLSLGCGVAVADEPKLWNIETKEVAKRLEATDFTKAEAWLTPGDAKVDYKKSVETWQANPLQLVDAVRKAAEKAHDAGKIDDFKKGLDANMWDEKKVPAEAFGSADRRTNFKKLLDALVKMSKDDLKNGDWLRALLRSIPDSEREAILRALGLTETDPNRTPTPTVTPTVTTTPTTPSTGTGTPDPSKTGTPTPGSSPTPIAPPAGSTPKDLLDAQQKLAAAEAELARMRAQIQKGGGSLEVNDAALQQQAKNFCDQLGALQRNSDNQLANAIAPLKDLANAIRNDQVNRDRDDGRDKKNRFDELQKAALAAAFGNQQKNDVQPPPSPVIPPSRGRSDSPEPAKNLFDGLQNQKQEEQPPQVFVQQVDPGQAPTAPNLSQKSPFPTISKTAFNRASTIVDENNNRPPVATLVAGLNSTLAMVGPNPMAIQTIGASVKSEIQDQIDKTKSVSTALGKESQRLDNIIEQAKAALANKPYTAQEQAALKQAQQQLERKRTEVNRAKQDQDLTIQQAQQVGDQNAVATATKNKSALDDSLKGYEELVKNIEEQATERKGREDANLQSLVRYQGQVEDKKSEVDASLGKLNNEMKQADTILNSYMSQLQQQQQPVAAPPQTSNVTRSSQVVRTAPGGSPTGGAPSGLVQRGASSTSSSAAGGEVMRGKLGGGK